MTRGTEWTLFDEKLLLCSRTLELELRRTHGTLFAATFIDEFEAEIRGAVIHALISKLAGPEQSS